VKLSVSVPDDTWTRARILYPGLGVSALVQEALRALLAGAPDPTPEQLRAFWDALGD
jgi:hypothetical protein